MNRRGAGAVRFTLLTAAFALATGWFGWWAVPVLGAVWGLVAAGTVRPAGTAGLAAAAAWALLLGYDAAAGPVGALAAKLGALAHLPGVTFLGLTLALPLALAAAAARVVRFRG